jgi:hypothetical protein
MTTQIKYCPECHREAYRVSEVRPKVVYDIPSPYPIQMSSLYKIKTGNSVVFSLSRDDAKSFSANSIRDAAGHSVNIDFSGGVRATSQTIAMGVSYNVGSSEATQVSLGSGNTYYVAKTGSDSYTKTQAQNQSTPWLTIQHAANNVAAGDTVYVKAGTYNEAVDIATSGTASNYITFQNYGSDAVTIDGTGLSVYPALLTIDGSSYINIIGFTIYKSNNVALAVAYGNHYVTLQNLVINTCVYSAIYVVKDTSGNSFNDGYETYITIDGVEIINANSAANQENVSLVNVSNFEIKNCKLHNSLNQAGFSFKVGCHNGSFHDNETYGLPYCGVQVDARGYNTHDIDYYRNKFHDSPYAVVLNDEVGGSVISYLNFYNNEFYNSTFMDVNFYYEAAHTKDHITFENNDFYNSPASIIINQPPASITNSRIGNNIFSQVNGSMVTYYTGYSPSSGMTIDHNLFYASGSYNPNNVYGTNYIKANPLLVNPPIDFSLQAGSPAIGAGSSVGAPTTDFIGTIRASPPCIGAYEFVSGGFTHGTSHTANFPVTVKPSGLSCQVELYLGPNASTKSSTSGLVAFTSTGASQNLSLPVTMPAAGTYNVYINIYAGGVLIGAYSGNTPVVVI